MKPITQREADELTAGGYRFVDTVKAAHDELQDIGQATSLQDLIERSNHFSNDEARTVVRIPSRDVYRTLRTCRNRILVGNDEQDAWSRAVVCVAGLSVGASAVQACALTGVGHLRIADPDVVSITNLNRLSASLLDIGRPKTELAERRVTELDPYIEVERFDTGYDPERAVDFLYGAGRDRVAAVVIEEVDSFPHKVHLRQQARTHQVPVISATDMGERVVLDIERYDHNPGYPIFHGLIDEDVADASSTQQQAVALLRDAITPRMGAAAEAMARRAIKSWPQLGSTSTTAGGLVAAVARLIVMEAVRKDDQVVQSGRYLVDVEELTR